MWELNCTEVYDCDLKNNEIMVTLGKNFKMDSLQSHAINTGRRTQSGRWHVCALYPCKERLVPGNQKNRKPCYNINQKCSWLERTPTWLPFIHILILGHSSYFPKSTVLWVGSTNSDVSWCSNWGRLGISTNKKILENFFLNHD
jgi:hypothetical protein